MKLLFTISYVLLFGLSASLLAEDIVYPPQAEVVNVKTAYGVKGDGKTDDAPALQKAVDENKGSNRVLYFPNGTYLLGSSVGIFNGKPHTHDRFVQIQGQSEAGAVIKLKDACPGFTDPAKPQIVLSLYEGHSTGDAMDTYVRNLTVDVGQGNPGAIGLRFMSNNVGAMDRVTIRSSDPKGAGKLGLDMRQSQNGPCLIKRVTVIGFDTGVETDNSFALVFEHLTLKHQNVVGFFNGNARCTVRGLKSVNRVTALRSKWDNMTLIEADLSGGSKDATAIISENDRFFMRDVKQSGYGHLLKDSKGVFHDAAAIDEWYEGEGLSLFGAAPKSLRLPIVETPDIPWETDFSKWAFVEKSGDITASLQRTIDEAAASGKTTICFPPGDSQSTISGPIRVHGSINRIIAMATIVNITDPDGKLKDSAVFTFEDLSSPAIVVERFFLLGGWKCPTHITMFANHSKKKIVLKDMSVNGVTKKADPGGTWFIEDISPARESTLAIGKGETCYARQFNPESYKADMIDVDGGKLWILGFKSEGRATHLIARNGAQAEVLGGVSYQSWGKQPVDPPMFKVSDSEVSVTFGMYNNSDSPFTTLIEETQQGQSKSVLRKAVPDFLPILRAGNGGK